MLLGGVTCHSADVDDARDFFRNVLTGIQQVLAHRTLEGGFGRTQQALK